MLWNTKETVTPVVVGALGKMTGRVGVFANGLGDRDSIPGRIIPKTQKWYLMPPCLALSTIS